MASQASPASAGAPPIDPSRYKRLDGESLDIEVGSRVLVEPIGTGRKIWTEFIGMKRGRFLIVQPPTSLEMRDLFRPDEEVTVRFAHKTYQICGFKVWIHRLIVQPATLLFMSFPAWYEALNMRRDTRLASVLPVTLRCRESEARGVIVNLSKGGCRVVVKNNGGGRCAPLEKDAEVTLSFSITGDIADIHAKGVVRSDVQDQDKLTVGVQFADLPDEVGSAIGDFIDDIGEYQNM